MCAIVLRVLPDEVQGLVLLLYQLRVRPGVVAADEPLADADMLVAPVEVAQVDGAVEGPRYRVIAHFPFLYRLARPFGGYAQVELSLTDARSIGVSAPVRISGDLEGAGACKIIGPKGEIDVKEGVIAAKSEIFAGTNEGGFAVVGLDEYTEKLEPSAQNLVKVTVGEHGECCVQDVVCTCEGIRFTLALGILQVELQSKLLGAHNALNIALAAALAFKLGMSKEEIAAGVAKIDYVPHRLQPVRKKGVVILDDAYNANVRGAQAAVEVLRLFPGRKIIVTPGLVELGILQQRENEALGGRLAGLDMVILVGETLVGAVKSGYLDAGGEAEKLTVVPTLQAAQNLLEKELREGDTVLFLNDLPDIYG